LKKLFIPFILFISVPSMGLSQEGKNNIIILEFESIGLDTNEVLILTDRFRSEIDNINLYTIDNRTETIKTLQGAAKAQGGCIADNCADKFGKVLGAKFVIDGSITQIGNLYSVETEIILVETGLSERSIGATYTGAVEGVLTIMEFLAYEIMGLKPPPELMARKMGINTGEKFTIGVMDFNGIGIIQMEAASLTDEFGTEIDRTGRVVSISRSNIKKIMLESKGWGFAPCLNSECAKDNGAVIGSQYVIGGEITKDGDKYNIIIKLFSTVTGMMKANRDITYKGPVDGLVTEIRLLAWDIMGLKPPKSLTSARKGKIIGPTMMEMLQSDRYKPMVLSTIVPGLGQLSVGKKKAARLYFGTVAFGVGMILYNYSEYSGAYDWSYELYNDNYLKQNNSVDMLTSEKKVRRAVKDVEWHNNQIKTFTGIIATAWILNIYNAYKLGKPKGDDLPWNRALNMKMGMNYNPYLNAPLITLSVNLP
jgi:TolB-like protein